MLLNRAFPKMQSTPSAFVPLDELERACTEIVIPQRGKEGWKYEPGNFLANDFLFANSKASAIKRRSARNYNSLAAFDECKRDALSTSNIARSTSFR